MTDVIMESTVDVAAFLPAEGSYTFNNCNLTGKGGIDALAGTVSLVGGSVTSTATQDDSGFEPQASDGTGPVSSKYAVLLRSKAGYGHDSQTLTFSVSEGTTLKSSGEETKTVKVHKSSSTGVDTIEIKGVDKDNIECGDAKEELTITVDGKSIEEK